MLIIARAYFLGYRSVHLDIEAQIIVSTKNTDLRRKMHLEKEALYSRSAAIDSSIGRKVPFWVRLVARLCRHMF